MKKSPFPSGSAQLPLRLTTRRAFMRTGALAVLAASSSLEMFGQGGAARQPSSLKSQAQYQAEAGEFDAAIRDFGQLSNFRAAAEAHVARFNQSVEAAAA